MILAGNVQSVDRVSEALRGLPDRTGRDDAGLETWITRAHYGTIKVDPLPDSLRSGPRFEALVQKVVSPKP